MDSSLEEEGRNRILKSLRFFYGDDNMAREFAKAFYQSKVWRETRAYVFERESGVCQRCHGLYGPGEIVHHVIHLTPKNIDNPAVTLDPNNLELLCRICHALEHEAESPIDTSLFFDANGNIVERIKL